jgi:hypothetical protein
LPIKVKADFNGDGIEDQAWILLKQNGTGWGVFVFLGRKNETPRIIKLEEQNDGKLTAQMFGISVAPPSNTMWKTACGKGYFECKPGEPEEIQITLPSIEFFLIESSCYLFMCASSIVKCNTWVSRKESAILSGYVKNLCSSYRNRA